MSVDFRVPFTARLPAHLHVAAQMVGQLEARSLNNLIEIALTEYLRERSAKLPHEVRATLRPEWDQ